MKMHIKTFSIMGMGAIGALFLTVAADAQTRVSSDTQVETNFVACTMDAKQCPDGSYVGREGPKCEFAACPGGDRTEEGDAAHGGTTGSAKGNVETEWKVEEGRGTPPPPPSDAPAEVRADGDRMEGEKGGTADINIGVGEMRMEGDVDGRMSTGISVRAVEVRGWNPEQKREFLEDRKAHAELHSNQDLELFARGVLVEDDRVRDIKVTEEGRVGMGYWLPARFLGFVDAPLHARAEVDADGMVSVRFPWFAFLFSDRPTEAELEGELMTSLGARADASAEGAARAGGILESIHAAFMARAGVALQ